MRVGRMGDASAWAPAAQFGKDHLADHELVHCDDGAQQVGEESPHRIGRDEHLRLLEWIDGRE